MRRVPVVLLACALLGLGDARAGAQTDRVLYTDGPTGRYLLDGDWLFRLDPGARGIAQGLHRSRSRTGWSEIRVPHVWNAGDDSDASMRGSVGWYRRDFEVPERDAALAWVLRFESVNYRTRAWLNGRPIGTHVGAYLPFELPARGIRRRGVNRLVVRVDSRRLRSDFPPADTNSEGRPTGGWWNYGGLPREVYLRRVDTVDLERVVVEPRLACAGCDSVVRMAARLRNVGPVPVTLTVRGRFGRRSYTVPGVTVPARGTRRVRLRMRIADPKLWSPERPYLYPAALEAFHAGRRVAAHHLLTGVRSIRVTDDGRLVLNGRYANLRGVGYHEDTRERGSAITNADREWLVEEARELGATMLRTHYPPHPRLHELADRRGMLLWSEIPVYTMRTEQIARPGVREAAYRLLRDNILANRNHPSVAIWSIANELSSQPGHTQGIYIRQARALARRLDPTRPVGLAVAGYPSAGCQTEYGPLDVIGINEYFGWYPGPHGQLFDRSRLPEYLQSVRDCYTDKAVMITEFGAEANRDGPVEEKGTWAHQQDFVQHHLGVYAGAPWLSGASYWALNEFRVRPGWDGGNPRPSPPLHQKGLVTYDRVRKPAWADVQRLFRQTDQFVRPR